MAITLVKKLKQLSNDNFRHFERLKTGQYCPFHSKYILIRSQVYFKPLYGVIIEGMFKLANWWKNVLKENYL